MHELAPQLTEAVAKRISGTDLHDSALRDLGAFVHRTIIEDEHTYAVRIDDGTLVDAAEQIEHKTLLAFSPALRRQFLPLRPPLNSAASFAIRGIHN